MTIKVRLVGPNGEAVSVTDNGELVVGPVAYNDPKFLELAEPNTAYNFFVPIARKQFLITGIVAKADRGVSQSVDALVTIYEASSKEELTVDKILHQDAMIRGERFDFFFANVLVNKGKWVNAKTSDDDIHMTITGHYVKEVS